MGVLTKTWSASLSARFRALGPRPRARIKRVLKRSVAQIHADALSARRVYELAGRPRWMTDRGWPITPVCARLSRKETQRKDFGAPLSRVTMGASWLLLRAAPVAVFALSLPAGAHAASAGELGPSGQVPGSAQRAASEVPPPRGATETTAADPATAETGASAAPARAGASDAASASVGAGVTPESGDTHAAGAPLRPAATPGPSQPEASRSSTGSSTPVAVANTPPQTQSPAPTGTTRAAVNTEAVAAVPAASPQPANAASSAPPSVTASAAGSMPARQTQAAAASAAWVLRGSAQQKEAGVSLSPDIPALTAQFASSAEHDPVVNGLALTAQMAGDARQALGSPLPQLSGEGPAGPPDSGARAGQRTSSASAPVVRGLSPDAWVPSRGSIAQSTQAVSAVAVAPVDTYRLPGAARRAGEPSGPAAGAAPTVRPAPAFPASRPAGRAAIGTGGGSGAPPAAALFALAVISLPLLLAGRVALDPLRCKSALLTSRLERPG
jgi:hypothetical protein